MRGSDCDRRVSYGGTGAKPPASAADITSEGWRHRRSWTDRVPESRGELSGRQPDRCQKPAVGSRVRASAGISGHASRSKVRAHHQARRSSKLSRGYRRGRHRPSSAGACTSERVEVQGESGQASGVLQLAEGACCRCGGPPLGGDGAEHAAATLVAGARRRASHRPAAPTRGGRRRGPTVAPPQLLGALAGSGQVRGV